MAQQTILTIILNYRTPELTIQACDAAMREMEGLAGEILVVDNASGDGSIDIILKAAQENGWTNEGRLRVLQSGWNGGFGAGMNFGMGAGLSSGKTPDYFYLLNSDAWPEPGAIDLLRNFLKTTPTAGLVGSHIKGPDGITHTTAFRFPSIAGEFEGAARTGIVSRLLKRSIVPLPQPVSELKVDWTAGASLMIKREVIEATGGFDEKFFLYFEETDLCRRAAQVGWSTHYLPQSSVVHIGSVSTGMKTWSRTPQYWFDSRMRYFTKNHGVLYTSLSTLGVIAAGTLWRLRRLVQRKPQADPDWFLRDLILHAIATPFRGPAFKVPPAPAPIPEDLK
ncbi:glycosyltransferase family 2 protein [Tropicibacter sp. Alg240-R139]|uniref:glycosyltransferase family 2 protein n=1 Tax=Tropicibacter sp. Alg240-R139 TaxID=2305991 RepID=UPI0013E026DF|nr:glycosyltransferase family 2 protein [Tropicibacter sp. Alg240-R139]